MKTFISRNRIIKVISICCLFLAWHLLSVSMGSEFLLPSPLRTLADLYDISVSDTFLYALMYTVSRGLFGFFLSLILAFILGILAGIYEDFNAFLRPVLVVFRSTPVISFILLALIWFSNRTVPVFIAFLTMFPILCTNIIEGVKNVDPRLKEMSVIYQVPNISVIRNVYLPSLTPFLFSGMISAMGFGWRAVVIGEVLAQPEFGIGTSMQYAQSYLLVSKVIAWTVVAVVLSYIFEELIRFSEKRVVKWK